MKIFMENFPYSENIDLVVRKMPQECKDASYLSKGWNSTMTRKVQYVIEALNETAENEWFVHSDCDIVLFEGWEDILQSCPSDIDMINQNDHSVLCAGFFLCKNNVRTRELWNKVLEHMGNFEHDQWAMNEWIRKIPELKVNVLPISYFTYGLLGNGIWNGQEFIIPDAKNLKMFHANWTVGVDNKIKLLREAVLQKNDLRL